MTRFKGAAQCCATRIGEMGWSEKPGWLVRPQGHQLVFNSQFLPLEIMDSHVVARRVFEFCSDGCIKTLVTLTQLPNACFKAHERHLLFEGLPRPGPGRPDGSQPTPTARDRSAIRGGPGKEISGNRAAR
jgi:hypothetical protein